MRICKHCGLDLQQDCFQHIKAEIGVTDFCVGGGILYWICPQCEKILKKGPYWRRYVEYMSKEGETIEDPEK